MARTTGSDELYRLVHSLSTNEKGYFQKYAKRHSPKGSDYLKLFDALNKMESYEEKLLKKKFKNLPDLKNYLFELIMDSVVISETSPTPSMIILKGIARINLLLKKGLIQKA